MDILNREPKNRSKSSVKIINKSIRRQEIIESFDKDNIKNSKIKKVYGNLPSMKRFKSQRDPKIVSIQSNIPSTPLNNHVNINQVISRTEKKIKKFPERSGEKDKLVYEILKAQSDKLELSRDLSTFDYNFYLEFDLIRKFRSIKSEAFSMLKSISFYEKLVTNGEALQIKVVKTIEENESIKKSQDSLNCIEIFPIKKSLTPNNVYNFEGMFNISGITCPGSITSQFYLKHTLKILYENSQYLHTVIEKKLVKIIHEKNISYKQAVLEYIIPHLYIKHTGKVSTLHFDEACGLKYYAVSVKLKGAKQKFTLFVYFIKNSVIFEVIGTNISLNITRDEIGLFETSVNIVELKKVIQKHLFWIQNGLVWGNCVFDIKETESNYLKDQYLAEAFNDYLQKSFSFKINFCERKLKIEGFECQKKKHIKIYTANSVITLQENSREYKLLFDLQSMDFYQLAKTLSKSLELKIILNSIFGKKIIRDN
ncbi:hypothetical protein SteCoe_14120 [Stentor coeruleus]|uniref:Uncharacterized protein n=1 Tax=Stentor coeruleus TaxID=5963 RepID=A0A1R2C6Y0_9CILI|nr:hypothetical protein SteCoe_14120 [Stentor coeruleus]